MNIFKSIKFRHVGGILLVVLFLYTLVSVIMALILPRGYTGPLGIGIPAKLMHYTSKNGDFSIVHPSTWPISETPNGEHGDMEVFAIINPGGRSFPRMVLAKKTFTGNNLQDVVKWGEERAQQLSISDYREVYLESQSINSFTGYIRLYTFKSSGIFGDRGYICRDWYFIDNSIGFDLSSCSEQKNWDKTNSIFMQMIQSFSIP